MTTALILGVGGQDGSHLADLLLSKGYEVVGLYRRSSVDNLSRLRHELRTFDGKPVLGDGVEVIRHVRLIPGDLLDPMSIARAVKETNPDEVWNLADQDHVGFSEATPHYSMAVTAGGAATAMEACRQHAPSARFFQPLSATMFGCVPPPQDEESPLDPQSPYAVAKVVAWEWAKHCRAKGLDVRCGIFFNHDSPRRGPGYLLQRIAREAVACARDFSRQITIGNPDALVDVGFAGDYVEAAWRIMQLPRTTDMDFCVGTGLALSVKSLCEAALDEAGCLNLGGLVRPDPDWPGERSKERLVADHGKLMAAVGADWLRHDAEGVVRMLVRHLTEEKKCL